MDDMKVTLDKRHQMTEFLEEQFAKEAVINFTKNKSILCHIDDDHYKNSYEYLTLFTRIWLNYLPDEQFNQVLRKMTGNITLKGPDRLNGIGSV